MIYRDDDDPPMTATPTRGRSREELKRLFPNGVGNDGARSPSRAGSDQMIHKLSLEGATVMRNLMLSFADEFSKTKSNDLQSLLDIGLRIMKSGRYSLVDLSAMDVFVDSYVAKFGSGRIVFRAHP